MAMKLESGRKMNVLHHPTNYKMVSGGLSFAAISINGGWDGVTWIILCANLVRTPHTPHSRTLPSTPVLLPSLHHSAPPPTARPLPTGHLAGVSAIAISSGWGHTCTIATGGYVTCWGDNQEGQLGTGDNQQKYNPVDVPGALWFWIAFSLTLFPSIS